MGLEVKKKERENSQNLIRRFTKKVQQSRILAQKRKNLFYRRKKSRQMEKISAIRRESLRREYDKLKKLGKTGKIIKTR